VKLRYPRDREYVVATVDGLPIWLEHLVVHIDERHFPGFQRLMSGEDGKGSPDGARILESDLVAPWVRHFATIRALEAEATSRGPIDKKRVEELHSAALKSAFERWLQVYVDDLRARGLPTELTQKRVDSLLSDYQMRNGLACELQGWLDYLEPPRQWSNQELNDFYQDHPRWFGGGVTIAHILVQNRDPGTGILLEEGGRVRAAARIADVQKRLAKDGANFADLAQQYSDDTTTGAKGGVLEYVQRFDDRLPAALCRTAWSLEDGQVSDVVETQYGWHLVRRIEHVQRMFLLFTEAMLPTVRDARHHLLQENLLFEVRARRKVELRL
jgi:hypothetical protein